MTNTVIIQGRLVAAPELKQTSSGVSVSSFALAHTRRFRGKGQEALTDFFDCKAWGNNAEFAARYLKKGMLINVTGKIETRMWEAQDGTKRKCWEINVSEMDFCEKKSDSSTDGGNPGGGAPRYSANKAAPNVAFEEVPDDLDLPF